MRRSLMIVIIGLFLMALTACSFEIIDNTDQSSGDAVEQTNEDNDTEEQVTDEEVNTEDDTEDEQDKDGNNDSIIDIYQKAINAAEAIKSAEIDMEMEQIIDYEGEQMEISGDFNIQMMTDPLVMHQKGTATMPFASDEDDTMDVEMYVTDDDLYMFESFSGSWIHIPIGEMAGMADVAEVDEQPTPYEQLKMFEKYIDQFSVEVTNDAYILHFEVDGDSFDELVREMVEETTSGDFDDLFGGSDVDPYEDSEFEQVEYKITFDKNTLQLRAYDMKTEMTITAEGETVHIIQDVRSVYSKINEIDSVEVPQEVIDGASGLF